MTTDAYAPYADVTAEVVRSLFFSVGARYSAERQRALAQEYPDGLPAQAYGGPLPPGVTSLASQDFHSFTPRAVLRWNLGPNANLYASYAKGYKSGGYAVSDFSQASIIPSFKPEEVTAYEAGLKAKVGTTHIETAVYTTRYLNQQNVYYTGDTAQIINAPLSRIYGAEISVSEELTRDFSVGVSAAYTHARYIDFPMRRNR